jgi:hypothetical protein
VLSTYFHLPADKIDTRLHDEHNSFECPAELNHKRDDAVDSAKVVVVVNEKLLHRSEIVPERTIKAEPSTWQARATEATGEQTLFNRFGNYALRHTELMRWRRPEDMSKGGPD